MLKFVVLIDMFSAKPEKNGIHDIVAKSPWDGWLF
jgi:hypothetical protein